MIRRHYTADDSLFPGKGPFPGLIDLYGGLVSIIETRAALLASHGYATMALSYLHVKGVFIEGNDGTGISYTKVLISFHTRRRRLLFDLFFYTLKVSLKSLLSVTVLNFCVGAYYIKNTLVYDIER